MKKIVIIGGGLAGLECARTLVEKGHTDLILLERNETILRRNSWKVFERTVKKFGLDDCVANTINEIVLRTLDIDKLEIIASHSKKIKALVLDSVKVYETLLKNIASHVKINSEVVKIEKQKDGYVIFTDKDQYEANIIVDASGVEFITENLLERKEFQSIGLFTCYGKRYSNCNVESIRNLAFFDFDSPFKINGTWCYTVDETTVEIGVSRFSNSYEMKSEETLTELEELFQKYTKLEPFNEVLKGAEQIELVNGYCSLLPRVNIQKDNIYIIGDSKGAVPFSGYGVENALESGRQCALSIIKKKKYDYFVSTPSRGLAGLKANWAFTAEQQRKFAGGIAEEFGQKRAFQFFTGEMTAGFFLDCVKLASKHGIKITDYVSKGLILRALFKLKPKKKHYESFLKKGPSAN